MLALCQRSDSHEGSVFYAAKKVNTAHPYSVLLHYSAKSDMKLLRSNRAAFSFYSAENIIQDLFARQAVVAARKPNEMTKHKHYSATKA